MGHLETKKQRRHQGMLKMVSLHAVPSYYTSFGKPACWSLYLLEAQFRRLHAMATSAVMVLSADLIELSLQSSHDAAAQG